MSKEYHVFHPRFCECGADLTKRNSIDVFFSVAGTELVRESCLDSGNMLQDIDNMILHGYHAGSRCVYCDESLPEMSESDLRTLPPNVC